MELITSRGDERLRASGRDAAASNARVRRRGRCASVPRSPLRDHVGGRAGRLAAVYGAVAALWIVSSSWVTRAMSDAASFELAKGLAFVLVTSTVLFGVLVAHDRSAEESATRMRRLIESAGDVAFRYRLLPPVGFEYISERITEWIGITPDEFYRRSDLSAWLVHPADRQALGEFLGGGTTTHSVPFRWLAPDGRLVHTLHDVREVLDRRGDVIAIDGRIRNVTDERRSQAESAVAEGILSCLADDLDADAIAQRTCDRLVALTDVDVAWIGVPLDDGGVRVIASAGDRGFVDGLEARWDGTTLGGGPTGRAIRERRAVTMSADQPGYAPWRQRTAEAGMTASLAVPLTRRGVTVAVLNVYSRFGNPFDRAHVDRFSRTAERLSLVMSAARRLVPESALAGPDPRRNEAFDVAAAIAASRIEPWWQPQVCSVNGRVVALEALVRARTITGELVMPNVILSQAEELGLMVTLGRALREQVIAQVPAWLRLGVERIAVNASIVELVEPGFALELLRLLDHHRVEPSTIEVELIETAPLDARAVRAITELATAGVGIAVDDYGSGFASLGHLAQLPATTLKIDRCFVSDLGSSARADQLVRSTFELAQSLDLVTVAEGVETVEQARMLQHMGCQLLQGYLFAAPMSTPDIEALLADCAPGGTRHRAWTQLLAGAPHGEPHRQPTVTTGSAIIATDTAAPV